MIFPFLFTATQSSRGGGQRTEERGHAAQDQHDLDQESETSCTEDGGPQTPLKDPHSSPGQGTPVLVCQAMIEVGREQHS